MPYDFFVDFRAKIDKNARLQPYDFVVDFRANIDKNERFFRTFQSKY